MNFTTPLTTQDVLQLKAGDWLNLSGLVYTARDAAHNRLLELINQGKPLPFNPEGAAIYYMGPSPTPPGKVIGSAGPTTSYRMDPYTPALAALGVKAFIGKGQRGAAVRKALVDNQAIYLAGIGGAAAWLSKAVREAEIIAFPDLGPEAIRCLHVEDLELICINDCYGKDYYEEVRKAARPSNTEGAWGE